MALSYVTPPTWSDGDKITAAMLNVYGRDNLTYLYGRRPFLRGAAVGIDSVHTVASHPLGSGVELIPWPRVYFDTGGYRTDTAQTTKLVAAEAERVMITVTIVAQPLSGTPPLSTSFRLVKNGAALTSDVPVCADTDYGGGIATVTDTAAAGDEYEVTILQATVEWELAGNVPGTRRCMFTLLSLGSV